MVIFDDVNRGFREGINMIVEKTMEWTRALKRKLDILGLEREIERLFSELGGRTFELLENDENANISADEEVKELIQKLKNLDLQLQSKKSEPKNR